ncbi:MAG: hypothetical protein O3B27_06925 [Actinomycetota bacterium]|nr:hypothetical protein [Actinomycetota bacterium]MDA2950853.1 hypothetical protein [Actinomycetota bacterium]MDA2991271.1 hypothetical protein [Actinomycetota bacterium]
MPFTRAEINEIQDRLNEGMTPQQIADSISRMADLEHADMLMIRSVATDLLNGEPVRVSDEEPPAV